METLSRTTSAPTAQVMRAKVLLAVEDGLNYTEAARRLGRRSAVRFVFTTALTGNLVRQQPDF